MYIRVYACACTFIYMYGVGFGVAVWIKRQYQSLDWRNSKIAVPLSFFREQSGTLFNRFPLSFFIWALYGGTSIFEDPLLSFHGF